MTGWCTLAWFGYRMPMGLSTAAQRRRLYSLCSQISGAVSGDKPLFVSLDGTEVELEDSLLGAVCEVKCLGAQTSADLPDDVLARADIIAVWHTIWVDEELVKKITNAKVIVRMGACSTSPFFCVVGLSDRWLLAPPNSASRCPCAGVGYDNVDTVATGKAGIAVCNIPNYGTEEVADAALCHILNLYRRVGPLSAEVEKGAIIQGPDAIAMWGGPSRRVRGQILGIIGFGRIGQATAIRAKVFGFDVRIYDPFQRDGVDKVFGVERYEVLEDLLRDSDCISLHANATEANTRMINASTLALFKKDAFLVNTARGELVDEGALADALRSGQLAGASLDVHWGEPFVKGQGPIGDVPNLICTPHNAWYSIESRREMRTLAVDAVKRLLAGQPLRNCVNAQHLVNARAKIQRQ
jgi:C-terminal binding protein